ANDRRRKLAKGSSDESQRRISIAPASHSAQQPNPLQDVRRLWRTGDRERRQWATHRRRLSQRILRAKPGYVRTESPCLDSETEGNSGFLRSARAYFHLSHDAVEGRAPSGILRTPHIFLREQWA